MDFSSFKPSIAVENILGENIASESEMFLLFIKAYYDWLQSSKITLKNTTGTFQRGELVVGSTTGFKGKITEVGTGYLILSVKNNLRPINGETIVGQVSGATSTLSAIKDNVIRKSGQLLDYRSIENSIDDYVAYLKDELFESIPLDHYGDKRLIESKFKDFFRSKSNEESYRFLFRLLYNEEIDFYYPGEDILRVSAGDFEKSQIIRTTATAYGIDPEGDPYDRNIFLFLNKTIRGKTSGYLANVVDIKKFFVGSIEVAEMTLKLVSGNFVAGEEIEDISDTNLIGTIYGIVSGFEIVDGGSGYQVGDAIAITGDGSQAQARVSSIKDSPISALKTNAIGYGYQLGTKATINNTGTGGSGLIVQITKIEEPYTVTSGANTYTVGEVSEVKILNRGENYYRAPTITLQDTQISSIGMLTDKLVTIANAGSNYGVGNTLVITGGAGTNAAGIVASVTETTTYDFLFEDGDRMTLDGSYYDVLKNQDWNVLGPIARIEFTNFGTGYTNSSLPSITVSSTTGSSANLIATGIQGTSANVSVDVANNVTGIGSIRAVEVTNFGIDYSTANANTASSGDGNAVLNVLVTGLGTKEGQWVNDKGKIDYKYIQDSYFYQDFSYVVKSGLGFSYYANTLKKIIHPAGLQLFGEILIKDTIAVTPQFASEIEIIKNKIETLILYIMSEFSVSASMPIAYYRREITLPLIETPVAGADREIFVSKVSTSNVSIINNVEYDIKVESPIDSSLIDVNIENNLIIQSESNTAAGAESLIQSLVPITGTVSSSLGATYGSLSIGTLQNVAISTIQARTFDENVALVVGNGTFFTSDFIDGDQYIANNEIFTVTIILDDTNLISNRQPSTPYTDVIAYKIVA